MQNVFCLYNECFLDDMVGINSLTFHVGSTGWGWILMASNVIYCKLHCHYGCEVDITIFLPAHHKQRYVKLRHPKPTGKVIGNVSSKGLMDQLWILSLMVGQRCWVASENDICDIVWYSVISCSMCLDLRNTRWILSCQQKWLFSSFHLLSICIPYPIHNNGTSRSNDSSNQSDVCGWCRAYGRIILSNHRKSQPVTRQTQARSTSL